MLVEVPLLNVTRPLSGVVGMVLKLSTINNSEKEKGDPYSFLNQILGLHSKHNWVMLFQVSLLHETSFVVLQYDLISQQQ